MEKKIKLELTEAQANLVYSLLTSLDFNADEYNELCLIKNELSKGLKPTDSVVPKTHEVLFKHIEKGRLKRWCNLSDEFEEDFYSLTHNLYEAFGPMSDAMMTIINKVMCCKYLDIDQEVLLVPNDLAAVRQELIQIRTANPNWAADDSFDNFKEAWNE